MNTVLALLVMVGVCAFTYGAAVGIRGKALHVDYYGRDVPDRVKTTPHLRARANRIFVVCSVAAATLLLAPLFWIFTDFQRERTTWELLGLAGYVFIVVLVGSYPFAKIKSL
ncbi:MULTISPECIES: hypothetical protein [unclassified Rhodococcus (in: high G+C Gram-positive bacteria)]|uniref:hypothetical protein n=1 Tax=unclassified Rhodococcus (in: high G+C Gram-positive bacteria) TaxID=192944 RepID=UPI000B9ABFC8|nr:MULTISPECIES: hypothetical protein [unclassified Rhodococcus (in: high G+C Gram-positive bacteria)]OZE34135.1 hypothetical protein CH259_19120 [Rhodococcus sp. 05-2254-4]OZE51333.1 hypothetical protein CH261_01805 [Rhodococcus sp. 05-2254-3]OZE52984.1 hypothetical protein CH283_06895 [Rhodococcus sp. 05-2254-2]